jgi:DNA-binding MarR family transcriptional regulator
MISILYRAGIGYIGRELEPLKIGGGQYTILLLLYETDGMRQEEVSSVLHVNKGTVARSVKALEAEGYIRKTQDELDGRAFRLWITEKGLAAETEIRRVINDWSGVLMAGFPADEKEEFERTLSRMMGNACPGKAHKGEV